MHQLQTWLLLQHHCLDCLHAMRAGPLFQWWRDGMYRVPSRKVQRDSRSHYLLQLHRHRHILRWGTIIMHNVPWWHYCDYCWRHQLFRMPGQILSLAHRDGSRLHLVQ